MTEEAMETVDKEDGSNSEEPVIVKVCPKMHLFEVCDDGETANLPQLMADVYQNLAFMSKTFPGGSGSTYTDFQRELEFLSTFVRCMLKWCVNGNGQINTDVFYVSKDVESLIVKYTNDFLDLVSCGKPDSAGSIHDELKKKITSFVPRIAMSFSFACKELSPPSTTIVTKELVQEYLEQALVHSRSFIHHEIMVSVVEWLSFLKTLLQFTNDSINREKWQELLKHVECALDTPEILCVFFKYHNSVMYRTVPQKVIETELHLRMVKAFMLLSDSSSLPLTVELLIEYLDNVQYLFEMLPGWRLEEKSKSFHHVLTFLRSILMNYKQYFAQEEISPKRKQIQDFATNIIHIVSPFVKNGKGDCTEEEMKSILDFQPEALKAVVWQMDHCPPLATEHILGYVSCLQEILTLMLKNNDTELPAPAQDRFKILLLVLETVLGFSHDQPKHHTVQDIRQDIQTVVGNLGSLLYTSYNNKNQGNIATAISSALSTPLTETVQALLFQLGSDPPPTGEHTMKCLNCIQQILNGLLEDGDNVISQVNGRFTVLLKVLQTIFLQSSSPETQKNPDDVNQEKLYDILLQVQDVVSGLASVIESSLSTNENVGPDISRGLSISLTEMLDVLLLQLDTGIFSTLEFLVKYVDCFQHIVFQLLDDGDLDVKDHLEDQFKSLHEALGFVSWLSKYPPDNHAKDEKSIEIITKIQDLVRKLGSAIKSSFDNEMKEHKIRDISLGLSDSLIGVLQVLLFQLDSALPVAADLLERYMNAFQHILLALLRDEVADLAEKIKDQVETVRKDHLFVVHLLFNCKAVDYTEQEKLFPFEAAIVDVVRDLGSIIYLSFKDKRQEETGEELNCGLSDLLVKVRGIKAQFAGTLSLVTLKRLWQKTPYTDALGFMDLLIWNLKELMDRDVDGVVDWKNNLRIIHDELHLLRSYFKKSESGDGSHNLAERIRSAAYEVEYLINSLAIGAFEESCRSFLIVDFEEQLKLIKSEAVNITENKIDRLPSAASDVSKHASDRVPSEEPTIDFVVGFGKEIEEIERRLYSDLKQLDIISIVGMPGLGKTTLAKKVYQDPDVEYIFPHRAWCHVSEEYLKKDLLLSILSSIMELTDDVRKENDVDKLSEKLHKELTGKKYLIVLDDVWEIGAFNYLQRYFPHNNNGSRIILTSRQKSIGEQAKLHGNPVVPIELQFLSVDESWELLKKKVYPGERKFPAELSEAGLEIAKRCGGLPLAVVAVAGHLAKSDKKEDLWKQVAKKLSIYDTAKFEEKGRKALELSYKLLPAYLKPLFLYLGTFPKDKEIPVEKLKWLWAAEGFLPMIHPSPEVQAQINLNDLIDRNLLMVAERRIDGNVKTCRIHDLMRIMSVENAREENFFLQEIMQNELPSRISDSRRVSILSKGEHGNTPAPETPCVTPEDLEMLSMPHPLNSLLFFNLGKRFPIYEKDIKALLGNHKLLRVLHFESATLYDNVQRNLMMMPAHLRYISVMFSTPNIPASIFSLWNLETMIIKAAGKFSVPDEIWKLTKLRNVHINESFEFNGAADNSSKLEKLETLSTPLLRGAKNQFIKNMPNIRKLRCGFLDKSVPGSKVKEFPELESLDKLESVKVIYRGTIKRRPCKFSFPPTLKKLSLSLFMMKWEEVSIFQNLEVLEVLKLCFRAVTGEEWKMTDGVFPALKLLKLESLDIKKWTASPKNYPRLENLVIEKCKWLDEIPCSFAESYILEKIEVLWCSESAAKSAKIIQAEQEKSRGKAFKVHIRKNQEN